LLDIGEGFKPFRAGAEQQFLQLGQVEFQAFDERIALGQSGFQSDDFFGENGGIHK